MLMRDRVRLVLTAAAIAALIVGSTSEIPVAAQDRNVDVLIAFNAPPGAADEALVRGVGGQIKHTYRLVPGMAATLPAAAVRGLVNNPRIRSIEPDVAVFATDTELTNSWGVAHIGAGLVHGSGNKGSGVKIAIIDSGVDYTHPDLAANYAGGKDFINNDDDPMDDDGHGTHVAGSALARDNDAGVVGVAPEATFYALKVLNENGTGPISAVIAALDWVVLHGIHITNNSYGTSVDPGILTKEAFDRAEAAGIINIAAAGNTGDCVGTGDNVGYPARYTSVVAVAATTSSNGSPCFSSTGPDVELAAPGFEVNSTLPGGTYGLGSGTSMASPHVAGTAALVLNAGAIDVNGNGRVNDEVRRLLDCTARDLGNVGRDTWYGFGLVDAAAAVAAVSSLPRCVTVSVTTDKATYFSTLDHVVTMTAVVTDEAGTGVTGLVRGSFVMMIDGGGATPVTDDFQEVAPATYSWSIALPAAFGTHTVVTKVTYDQVTGGGSASFAVADPFVMRVASIGYTQNGGPKNNRNLRITVAVVSGTGAAVADATVSIVIRRNGVVYTSGTARTATDGRAIFELKNAPSGTYQTQITGVTKGGLTWDQATPPNQYSK